MKLIQGEMYTEEISDLEKQGNVKDTSGIVRLRPMLIDGVMRIGSHISLSPHYARRQVPYDYSSKTPCGSIAD